MNFTSYIFRVKLTCPDCNNAVPVNKIKDKLTCHNCQTVINLASQWWKDSLLTKEYLEEAKKFEEGIAQTVTTIGGELKYDLAYGKRFPRCQKCKDDLSDNDYWTLDDILQAASSGDHIYCKKCNEPHTIRKPDDFVSSLVDSPVLALVGEEDDPVTDSEYKGKAMMFACLSCGAGLKADGSSRTVECTYCNTDNFLPEELWRRLHPIPKPVVFFMVKEN